MKRFFQKAAVTFSVEIVIEMSSWSKSTETCRGDPDVPKMGGCSKKKDQHQ